MKRSLRMITTPRTTAVTLLAVVLTSIATVTANTMDLATDSTHQEERTGTHLHPIRDFSTPVVSRRLDQQEGFSREVEIGDIFVFAILSVFVVALAFPVAVLTYCVYCPRMLYCMAQSPRDTPPSEVDVIAEPSGDYHFVTQVSSTSMSTCNDVQVV